MEFDLGRLKRCGVDVRIRPNVVIKYPELVSISDHVAIDDFTYITTSVDFGSYIHVGPHCSIIGGIEGKFVMEDFAGLSADYLGSGLTNPVIPPAYRGKRHGAPITMQKHAILGTGCIVHPGVTIGEGAAVGSGSLVLKSLDPWGVYFGVPARRHGTREKSRILEYEKDLRGTVIENSSR
jgi:acetyltransferase-like isoleucine patch superfamily enzyme